MPETCMTFRTLYLDRQVVFSSFDSYKIDQLDTQLVRQRQHLTQGSCHRRVPEEGGLGSTSTRLRRNSHARPRTRARATPNTYLQHISATWVVLLPLVFPGLPGHGVPARSGIPVGWVPGRVPARLLKTQLERASHFLNTYLDFPGVCHCHSAGPRVSILIYLSIYLSVWSSLFLGSGRGDSGGTLLVVHVVQW
jgi:hypothetical protein